MLALNNLRSPKGSHRNTKRIGRGQGSGQGTQAGKGDKGQKARKSGHVRIGFESGSMPIYIRLPKRNIFKNTHFKVDYTVVNLCDVQRVFNDGALVTPEELYSKGLISSAKLKTPIKVLAKVNEENSFSKKLNFSNFAKFSQKAIELVKRSGGTVEGH